MEFKKVYAVAFDAVGRCLEKFFLSMNRKDDELKGEYLDAFLRNYSRKRKIILVFWKKKWQMAYGFLSGFLEIHRRGTFAGKTYKFIYLL